MTRRIKGILTAVMYVAIFYGVSTVVQLLYMLWQNSGGEIEVSRIETNLINGAYALNVISMIITFWIYLIIGKIRKKRFDKVIFRNKLHL